MAVAAATAPEDEDKTPRNASGTKSKMKPQGTVCSTWASVAAGGVKPSAAAAALSSPAAPAPAAESAHVVGKLRGSSAASDRTEHLGTQQLRVFEASDMVLQVSGQSDMGAGTFLPPPGLEEPPAQHPQHQGPLVSSADRSSLADASVNRLPFSLPLEEGWPQQQEHKDFIFGPGVGGASLSSSSAHQQQRAAAERWRRAQPPPPPSLMLQAKSTSVALPVDRLDPHTELSDRGGANAACGSYASMEGHASEVLHFAAGADAARGGASGCALPDAGKGRKGSRNESLCLHPLFIACGGSRPRYLLVNVPLHGPPAEATHS
ncbi:RRM domain-containing protein [Cyclospora cayetanensis]|uniref:RRM domain-containing protein n=1 Tax=Cyclospora cayetanensis TaxID=88456 RepID=A0A1D3D8Y0_9EIME|nr:RRM domain-containing protein [Cyclospora cayetanensis]